MLLLVLALLLAAAVASGVLRRMDGTLYDAAQALWARAPNPDIVIVSVDENSLSAVGRWPWRRAVHAAMLERLREARAVGYDVIFAEPDERDPAGDWVLAAAVASHGRVVLPVLLEARAGSLHQTIPIPTLAQAAAGLGHIHLDLDEDGIGRRIWWREGLEGAVRPHFMAVLAGVGGVRLAEGDTPPANAILPLAGGLAPRNWVREGPWLIPFAGRPGHFTRVSAVALLRGDIPPGYFKDKWVLVGATAAGLGDEYPTPVSGLSGTMPGVEVNANILDAALAGVHIKALGAGMASVVAVVLVTLAMVGFLWLSPRGSLILVSSLILGGLALCWGVLRYLGWWVPPAASILMLVLAYPLWNWRRLEATQRYLTEELGRLAKEPEWLPLGETAGQKVSRFAPDVIGRRIEEVRVATERLRRLRRLVADTLDSLPEAAMLIDRSGQIVLANARAAEYCGAASPEGMAGTAVHPWLASLQGSEHVPVEDALRAMFERGESSTMEVSGPAGRVYTAAIAPCVSEVAGVSGAIVSLTDVSALRLEERQRRELMSFLTHDIRSPQAAIITLVDSATGGAEGTDTAQTLGRVRQYARRALTLSDDLFRFLQAERLDPAQFSDVDMADVIQEVVDEFWHRATAKGIRLHHEAPAQPCFVAGNRGQLVRMVANLVDNAIKYSPAQRDVSVTLAVKAESCRLEVRDHGFGIPAERLGQVFTRAARFHSDSHPEIPGSGLGLAFVKLVAEKHGGRVGARSELGEGTVMQVSIPLAETGSAAANP